MRMEKLKKAEEARIKTSKQIKRHIKPEKVKIGARVYLHGKNGDKKNQGYTRKR
jgi:hypothetical protein